MLRNYTADEDGGGQGVLLRRDVAGSLRTGKGWWPAHFSGVLIAPELVEGMDRELQILYKNLTKQQVKNSPGIEIDRLVADQQEIAYHGYRGTDLYWRSGWQTLDPAAVPGCGDPPYLPAERLT